MTSFIDDDMMEMALKFLATSSDHVAEARANRYLAEHKRKRIKASLILDAPHTSAAMREAWAECHREYSQAVDDEYEAIKQDEYYRAERAHCEAIIEAWRSEQANNRAGSSFR